MATSQNKQGHSLTDHIPSTTIAQANEIHSYAIPFELEL